ncbi:MAG TPA: hypothetical protein VFH83_06985 [Spirochaetia bacterium]|nr:hypothetical protein [Spirochaetia bacterium]
MTAERERRPEARTRRRWGDRYDGRRVRSLNPLYQMTPYIMRSRVDAQVYFEDQVEIGPAERWLRQMRDQGSAKLGLLHVLIAASVRTLSQKPRLNRFVAGQRIFARNEILISLALKKKLQEDSPETTIKLAFLPTDTIFDVADRINAAVAENKDLETQNETDATARLFMMAPGFLVRFLVWLFRTLDFYGKLPRAIHRASPFHTSIFVTDLGSLGIRPIYHHLYEFGTTSVFVAFGIKERRHVTDRNGAIVERRSVGIKVVGDERICDGHYFASAFRYLTTLLRDPRQLESPPERVVDDEE